VSASAITTDVVCEDFRQAIKAVVDDEDFLAEITLSADSIISQDLQLDSVEVVRVFEYFLTKYADAPLVEWFSSQSVDALMAMTVRDLADFLGQHVIVS